MNLRLFQTVLIAVGLMVAAPVSPTLAETPAPAERVAVNGDRLEEPAEPVAVNGDTTLEELRVIVEREVDERVPDPDVGLFLVTDDPERLTPKIINVLIEGGEVDGIEVRNRTDAPAGESTVGDLGELGPTTVYLGVKLIRFWIFDITLLCRWDDEKKEEVCTVDDIRINL